MLMEVMAAMMEIMSQFPKEKKKGKKKGEGNKGKETLRENEITHHPHLQ